MDNSKQLLNIPTEVRMIIYSYLLVSKNGRIRRYSDQNSWGKIDTAILATNKQIYNETRNILAQTTTCVLSVRKSHTTGYQFSEEAKLALFSFRRVILEPYLVKTVEFENDATTSLGHAFQQLIPILRMWEIGVSGMEVKEVKVRYRRAYRFGSSHKLDASVSQFHIEFQKAVACASPGMKLSRIIEGADGYDV